MRTIKKKAWGHSQKRNRVILSDKSPFSVQEAYKELRTNVMFSLPGTGCKCVGITSPTPGDGKSTTAANLAISLAQIGKKVILIDCDLRLPSVADSFRLKATPGVSDFLAGQAKIEETIRQVDLPTLNIMPAGSIPPDSTGLLEGDQVAYLFQAFRSIYDYVVVDLPPVTVVPDASILSKYIDGFLLVVRNRQTRHRYVEEMFRQFRLTQSKILGIVTTGSGTLEKKYYRYEYRKHEKL